MNSSQRQKRISAAMRADHLFDQGDIAGCNTWKRIVSAIKEIQQTARPEGKLLN